LKKINNKKIHDYVIFPLNCLGIDAGYKFLLQCILDYGLISSVLQKYSVKDIRELLKGNIIKKWSSDEHKSFWEYFNSKSKKVRAGTIGNNWLIFLRYKIIADHNGIFENKYGKDANVLINTELLYDILTKEALKEIQFRILSAIYSKIGNSAYKIVFNKEIRHRLNGFKSEKIYEIEGKTKYPYVSNKILRKEINFMMHGEYSRNFFDRVMYGKRIYYYSRVIRGKKLENIILKKRLVSKVRLLSENTRNKNIENKYKEILNKMKSPEFDSRKLENLIVAENSDPSSKVSLSESKIKSKAKRKLEELRKDYLKEI
jgi:hypothetical protein